MLHIFFICLTLFAELPDIEDPQAAAWIQWKNQAFEKAQTAPTSFLNAYALEQGQKGQTLYLQLYKTKKDTQWTTKKPKDFYASAEHLGDKIRIQIRDKTMFYLSNDQGKRRKDFKLPNGAIAEVVYGKRNQKMWTYLYDPDQIKSFTGFRFYPFNRQSIVEGVFKSQKPKFVSYKTVQGDPTKVNQIGNVSFNLNGKSFYLPAYNWQQKGQKIEYVALVFTDNTKGTETYSGGRELSVDTPDGVKDGMKLELDFNRTVNFYCAHSPFWHCPVGLQKHLDTKVNAGEKLPLKKIM